MSKPIFWEKSEIYFRMCPLGFLPSMLSVTGYRYMIHLYCLAVQAGFYSDVVECRTLSPEDQVRSPVGKMSFPFFSPVTFGAHCK